MQDLVQNLGKLLYQLCWQLAGPQALPNSPEYVELPYLGKISAPTAHQLFRTWWKLQNWPDEENLAIVWKESADQERRYLLTIAASTLRTMREIGLQEDVSQTKIVILMGNLLQKAGAEGGIPLLLAILRTEGIQLSRDNWIWEGLAKKVRISPASLELVCRWLFPFSGIGIVLWLDHRALPWIFYGGNPPVLQLQEQCDLADQAASGTDPLVAFTQALRSKHHLAMAISVSIEYLSQLLQGKLSLMEVLQSYTQEWAISTPLEINDFWQHLPQLLPFLPGQEQLADCHITKKELVRLVALYLENGWKYIKRTPLYLELKDKETRLILEITTQGIYETVPGKPIPPQNLFTIDVEIMATLASWLNDASLKLMAHLVKSVIPAQIAEPVARQEILMALIGQEPGGRTVEIFICGGLHDLPSEWQGDFSIIVMAAQDRIVFQECWRDAPLMVTVAPPTYRVDFPPAGSLQGKSLQFIACRQLELARGLASLVSTTSVLAEIVPGLRTDLVLGELQAGGELSLGGTGYRILSGTILIQQNQGLILKGRHFTRHLTHTWLTPKRGGVLLSGTGSGNGGPEWWQNFQKTLENKVAYLSHLHSKILPPAAAFLPYATGENQITTNGHKIGWQDGRHVEAAKFWIMSAWLVPFDKRGNCLVRARALAKVGRQRGFALLEFPCHWPYMLEKLDSVAVRAQKEKNGLTFYQGDAKVLTIQAGRSLRILNTGWRRWFR